MKILFTQTRYHPNQHPIVKELIERGHEVKYVVRDDSMGETEHYAAIEPDVLGYSKVSESILKRIGTNNLVKNACWPPIGRFYKLLTEFEPDLVVSRGYSVYSLAFFLMSKRIGAEFILFTQRPKYRQDDPISAKIIHRLRRAYQFLFDKKILEYTPVKGDVKDGIDTIDRYYIPFVVDPDPLREIDRDSYFRDGYVNIISVGQFHLERKRHILLLDAVRKLVPKYDIRLTLVGHLKSENSPNFQRIMNYIHSNNLDERVDIKTNLEYIQLQREYCAHDLYVLPSENEPAAMSHLEAMSQGLPVICSDSNGTDDYITEGVNGYVFQTNALDDLTEKIEAIISDRNVLVEMGCQSRTIVEQNYLPTHFCSQFNDMLKTVSEHQV